MSQSALGLSLYEVQVFTSYTLVYMKPTFFEACGFIILTPLILLLKLFVQTGQAFCVVFFFFFFSLVLTFTLTLPHQCSHCYPSAQPPRWAHLWFLDPLSASSFIKQASYPLQPHSSRRSIKYNCSNHFVICHSCHCCYICQEMYQHLGYLIKPLAFKLGYYWYHLIASLFWTHFELAVSKNGML